LEVKKQAVLYDQHFYNTALRKKKKKFLEAFISTWKLRNMFERGTTIQEFVIRLSSEKANKL
jgi:hypothetical protein